MTVVSLERPDSFSGRMAADGDIGPGATPQVVCRIDAAARSSDYRPPENPSEAYGSKCQAKNLQLFYDAL
jgi:hypothetical protein